MPIVSYVPHAPILSHPIFILKTFVIQTKMPNADENLEIYDDGYILFKGISHVPTHSFRFLLIKKLMIQCIRPYTNVTSQYYVNDLLYHNILS